MSRWWLKPKRKSNYVLKPLYVYFNLGFMLLCFSMGNKRWVEEMTKDYWRYFCVYPFQFNSTNVFFLCNRWLTNVSIFQRCELAYCMKNWQCKNVFMKKMTEKSPTNAQSVIVTLKWQTENGNEMTDYNSQNWWKLRLGSLTCNRWSSNVIQYINLSSLRINTFWFLSALHAYWVLIVFFIRNGNIVKEVYY